MKKGMFGSKKGLSEVVTTLLFVLLALGAVLLVWFVVRGLISGSTTSVNVQNACLNLGLEIKSCTITTVGIITTANVVYQRGNTALPDDFQFNNANLVFQFDSGETKAVETVKAVPGVLESKLEPVEIGTGKPLTTAPKSVGVSGILLANGKDNSCAESARVTCTIA